MDTLILVARVGLSLAAVLGLLWWLGRRMQSKAGLRRRRREGLVMLGRQQLGGKSGVALVEAYGYRLVVGYGEQGVSLLLNAGETPLSEEELDERRRNAEREILEAIASDRWAEPAMPAPVAAPVPARANPARTAESLRPRTPLEGSILAPDTWRKAVVAAQEWTTRRS